MCTVFNELMAEWDEIESITYVGEEETLDINVTGNRLFYANDILTHNSAVEEIEFDHSHISGGLSKINTADNVFGIFTSRAMRERGRYQLQLMKTRSSSGVGMKVDLVYDLATLRITDPGEDGQDDGFTASHRAVNVLDGIKTGSTVNMAAVSEPRKVNATVDSSKLKSMLAGLKNAS